jgi:zinc transporter 5/7
MASSYALPASMMSHDHHGHAHLHSHSHSPSRHPQHPANTPKTKTLRQEKSNSSLYGHSHSDPRHEHTHSHSHAREPSLPTPPNSNGLAPGPFEQQAHESSPALSRLEAFEPSLNALNILPNGHHHHGHSDASHAKSVEPRSRFTSYILPFVLRWPLLHTVMSEKDSRRIFYFMR